MNICEHTSELSITSCRRNVYQLNLGYKIIDLTFCQLLSLRNKILKYSSHNSLEEIIDTTNFVLLPVADNKHLIYLDVSQLLQLKEVVRYIFKKPVFV